MNLQSKFNAFVVTKNSDKSHTREIQERNISDLPPGELLIRVHYSSLNYKDALSATGHPGVTRQFPHTPGIDAAGEVVSCTDGTFATGEKVLVTGYDLGMETDGGFGQFIRIPSAWALRIPTGLSLQESMTLGTAGFTAALSVMKLQEAGVRPGDGDLLVTGATGGVGSIAVAILAKLGYRVVASTGKASEQSFLTDLGAAEVISRTLLTENADKALKAERWGGVVDVVGGTVLAAALKSTKYGGVVTCCGMVGSPELLLNMYPFILRSVSLIGIDSVNCPRNIRENVWSKLATAWKPPQLVMLQSNIRLDELDVSIKKILSGNICGRVVINLF